MQDVDPYPCAIKNADLVYTYANRSYKRLFNITDIKGMTDFDLKEEMSLFAAIHKQQSRLAFKKKETVTTIEVHEYQHGLDIYTFSKTPILSEKGNPIALALKGLPMRALMNSMLYAELNSFGDQFDTSDHRNDYFNSDIELTDKQGFVLFWVLRSRTSKEIARMTKSTPKAIDKHIYFILKKFAKYGPYDRHSLFEYCRSYGWFSYIPPGVLRRPTSIIIN